MKIGGGINNHSTGSVGHGNQGYYGKSFSKSKEGEGACHVTDNNDSKGRHSKKKGQ